MDRVLITEKMILDARRRGEKKITIRGEALLTPSARDAVRQFGIEIVTGGAEQHGPSMPADAEKPSIRTSRGPVAIGADHGGFALKSVLVGHLHDLGFEVRDVGTFSTDAVDYPDYAEQVALLVSRAEARAGIIVDGAGIGSCMAANKVPGVRAACCNDLYTAANSREHNGANVLTLGSMVVGEGLAKKIVTLWLQTDFGGGRHKRRVDKIMAIEQKHNR